MLYSRNISMLVILCIYIYIHLLVPRAPHATASYRRLKPREDHADDQLSEAAERVTWIQRGDFLATDFFSAEHQTW